MNNSLLNFEEIEIKVALGDVPILDKPTWFYAAVQPGRTFRLQQAVGGLIESQLTPSVEDK